MYACILNRMRGPSMRTHAGRGGYVVGYVSSIITHFAQMVSAASRGASISFSASARAADEEPKNMTRFSSCERGMGVTVWVGGVEGWVSRWDGAGVLFRECAPQIQNSSRGPMHGIRE